MLQFWLQNNVYDGNTFSGYFIPVQAYTDQNGKVLTKFHPDSNCPAQCSYGKSCMAEIIATTPGGAIRSAPLTLQINIP